MINSRDPNPGGLLIRTGSGSTTQQLIHGVKDNYSPFQMVEKKNSTILSLCVSQLLESGEGGRFWGGGATVCDEVASFLCVHKSRRLHKPATSYIGTYKKRPLLHSSSLFFGIHPLLPLPKKKTCKDHCALASRLNGQALSLPKIHGPKIPSDFIRIFLTNYLVSVCSS